MPASLSLNINIMNIKKFKKYFKLVFMLALTASFVYQQVFWIRLDIWSVRGILLDVAMLLAFYKIL